MEVLEWFHLLAKQIKQTELIEWIGVSFGIAQVLLARINNILLYPFGIVSVLISTYIFYQAGLYAEGLLNVHYLIMSIYGWYIWVKKKNKPEIPVSYARKKDWLVASTISLGGFLILFLLLKQFTDSTVPAWDAWISATAWAGMWLLAKRKIENWIFLNISNALAIPLLFIKSIPLYAILTIVLFAVAISGYIKWYRIIQENKSNKL
jgi:nicotinamide mononucleotide transporter